jgi:hypothetical protein
MVSRLIPIPSDDNKIYRQILGVLNFILNITPQEIDVLAEIIKLNHEYSALPEDKRAKFILSTDMRKETRSALDIEEKQFNSLIARLKKKKFMDGHILSENGVLHKYLLFLPDDEGFKIEIVLKKGATPKVDKPKAKDTKQDDVPVEKKSADIPAGKPEEQEEEFDIELFAPEE